MKLQKAGPGFRIFYQTTSLFEQSFTLDVGLIFIDLTNISNNLVHIKSIKEIWERDDIIKKKSDRSRNISSQTTRQVGNNPPG